MALFDELSKNRKIEEPAERKAEKIRHADNGSKKRYRKKSSSVSLNTINTTLTILTVASVVVIFAGVVYLGYLGFNLYVNG